MDHHHFPTAQPQELCHHHYLVDDCKAECVLGFKIIVVEQNISIYTSTDLSDMFLGLLHALRIILETVHIILDGVSVICKLLHVIHDFIYLPVNGIKSLLQRLNKPWEASPSIVGKGQSEFGNEEVTDHVRLSLRQACASTKLHYRYRHLSPHFCSAVNI